MGFPSLLGAIKRAGVLAVHTFLLACDGFTSMAQLPKYVRGSTFAVTGVLDLWQEDTELEAESLGRIEEFGRQKFNHLSLCRC